MLLHDDHGDLLRQQYQPLGDLLDDADPNAFGRFIQQQDLGIRQHRATNRQHLALAAGQCAGELIEPLRKLWKDREHPVDRGRIAIEQRADGKVVAYRQASEHRMLLRYVTDPHPGTFFRLTATNVPAVESQLSLRQRQLADDRFHERRLPGAIAASTAATPPRQGMLILTSNRT